MGFEDSQLMKPGAFHACNSKRQIFFFCGSRKIQTNNFVE